MFKRMLRSFILLWAILAVTGCYSQQTYEQRKRNVLQWQPVFENYPQQYERESDHLNTLAYGRVFMISRTGYTYRHCAITFVGDNSTRSAYSNYRHVDEYPAKNHVGWKREFSLLSAAGEPILNANRLEADRYKIHAVGCLGETGQKGVIIENPAPKLVLDLQGLEKKKIYYGDIVIRFLAEPDRNQEPHPPAHLTNDWWVDARGWWRFSNPGAYRIEIVDNFATVSQSLDQELPFIRSLPHVQKIFAAQ